MADAMFTCKTHDAKIYDYAHITEHKCISVGRCDIHEANPEPVETPESSRFDLNDDPRNA